MRYSRLCGNRILRLLASARLRSRTLSTPSFLANGSGSPSYSYVAARRRRDDLESFPATRSQLVWGCRSRRLPLPGKPGEPQADGGRNRDILRCVGIIRNLSLPCSALRAVMLHKSDIEGRFLKLAAELGTSAIQCTVHRRRGHHE